MKLIFLDFDGVLNCAGNVARPCRSFMHRDRDELDPVMVERLNCIIRLTDARVVISSSWRIIHTLEELVNFLVCSGFKGSVIGVTPRIQEQGSQRGDEIQKFINEMPEKPTRFVILDDDSDMAHLMNHFVQTDWEWGLQDEHIKRVVKILNDQETSSEDLAQV